MSLIVSRRGNIVSPQGTGGQTSISLSGGRRRNNQQRGIVRNGATRAPQQIIVRAAPSSPAGAGRRRRRRGGAGGLGIPLQAPATFGVSMGGGFPTFRSMNTPGTCGISVSHSEILTTVNGSTAFSGLRIPMVPSVFAWVQGVGVNFSRFRWTSLRADFVTASPTSQGGTIAMGAVYDEADTLPNSIGEMKSLAHSIVAPVWGQPGTVSHSTVFDPSRWSKPWYSFTTANAAAANFYSPAYLVFGRQTQNNGQPIGHLVVTYTIEMIDPVPSRINLTSLGSDTRARRESNGIVVWEAEDGAPAPPVDRLDRLIEALANTPALGLGISMPEPESDSEEETEGAEAS
jgi:hypothetical protein